MPLVVRVRLSFGTCSSTVLEPQNLPNCVLLVATLSCYRVHMFSSYIQSGIIEMNLRFANFFTGIGLGAPAIA